jgi:hypothetical protein
MRFIGIGCLDNERKATDEKQNNACQLKGVKKKFRPFNFLADGAVWLWFSGWANRVNFPFAVVVIKAVCDQCSGKNYRKGDTRRHSEKQN